MDLKQCTFDLVRLINLTTESPRWLVLHNRKDTALKSLNKLRPKRMAENGVTAREISAIDAAIESSHAGNQGSWLDLFRGTYLRRTLICTGLFWFHESTGQQFVNSYGPTFFKQIGLGSQAFTYSFIAQAAGVAGALIAMFLVDRVGRRPVLICGLSLAALFNFLVAGFGSKPDPSSTQISVVIASIILLNFSCKFSINMLAFLITAEIGGVKMRKKSKFSSSAISLGASYVFAILLTTDIQL